MICPSCSKDVHPYDDMGSDMRVVSRCPRAECNSIIVQSAPQPTVAPAEPREPVRRAAAPGHHLDVLGLAKARLVALEGELAALEAKRTEAAMLRRMILAAELTEDDEERLDA